jgi:hypothetical protein
MDRWRGCVADYIDLRYVAANPTERLVAREASYQLRFGRVMDLPPKVRACLRRMDKKKATRRMFARAAEAMIVSAAKAVAKYEYA